MAYYEMSPSEQAAYLADFDQRCREAANWASLAASSYDANSDDWERVWRLTYDVFSPVWARAS